MRRGARISVIIPALNEERSIGKVVSAIPAWVDEVLVVDMARSTELLRRRERRTRGLWLS